MPISAWASSDQFAAASIRHETPVQMLAPGNGKTKTAYLLAYRRGEIHEPPIIVFDFVISRSGANARRFLEHYGGALVVDDYAGYKPIFQTTPILREVACCDGMDAGGRATQERLPRRMHGANSSSCTKPTKAPWPLKR